LPKWDGIRCCKQMGLALTYNLKPIRNDHIRTLIQNFCHDGIDVELIIEHTVQDYFNNTQSGVMSKEGRPKFTAFLIDYMPQNKREEKMTFIERWRYGYTLTHNQAYFMGFAQPLLIHDIRELLHFEQSCLKRGYEGVILRSKDGIYKYGRSTLKQFWMIKYKRFADSEAITTGFEELQSNQNKPIRNEVGTIKRSSHKVNMVSAGMLGALIGKDTKTDIEVRVGSFKLKERKEIWRDRNHKTKSKLGRIFTYRYQEHGMKNRPRFGTFKGWRPENEEITIKVGLKRIKNRAVCKSNK